MKNIDTSGFLRDFGLYFKAENPSKAGHSFQHLPVSEISGISPDLYCLNITLVHEGERFSLIVDFPRDIMTELAAVCPDEDRQAIEQDLLNSKIYPVTVRLPVLFSMHVEAELGDLTEGEYEEFIPFVAKKLAATGFALVPSALGFADSTEVDSYEEIAVDFFDRVLGMDYMDCCITDQSSIDDFSPVMPGSEIVSKVLDIYRVDISDIKDGNLVQIFKRISLTDKQLSLL